MPWASNIGPEAVGTEGGSFSSTVAKDYKPVVSKHLVEIKAIFINDLIVLARFLLILDRAGGIGDPSPDEQQNKLEIEIMTIKKALGIALLLIGFNGASNAAIVADSWSDDINFGSGVYVGAPFNYTHTLDDFSLPPSVILDWNLTVKFSDDGRFGDIGPDFASVTLLGGGSGSGGNLFGSGNFNVSINDSIFNLGVTALLNLTGQMFVTISPILGTDFMVRSSHLNASGYTVTVPEPGTLALLGLGLLGLAVARRRRSV